MPVIFMYHGVTATDGMNSNYFGKHVHVERFREQLEYISRNYRIVPLDDLVRKLRENDLTENIAVITFDDGYLNNFTVAYPVLRALRIPATIYLTTGYIGSDNWFWTDLVEHAIVNMHKTVLDIAGLRSSFRISTLPEKLRAIADIKKSLKCFDETSLMSTLNEIKSACSAEKEKPFENYQALKWDHIAEMNNNGITFGAHTVNHVILSRYPFERAEWEIIHSKKTIEEKTKKPVTSFCFPNGKTGDFTFEIKKCLADHFQCALSANSGRVMPDDYDLFELKRVGMENETSCTHLARNLRTLI